MLKIFLVVALVAQTSFSRVISNQDERILFDDMLLTPEQYNRMITRKMVSDTDYFWKKNSEGIIEIQYVIEDPNVNADIVLKGQADWERNTCVKFTPLTGDPAGKAYFKYVSTKQNSCFAQLGHIANQAAELNIGWNSSACNFQGVIHEIGHTLGFHHEMSRADRDPSIIILEENLAKPSQFKRANSKNYGVPYDYMSIMHYQAKAGTKNNKIGMLATDPRFQNLMGEYKDFSFMDLLLFNKAYKCIDDWLKACKLSAEPCKNMGFTGKDCKCVCPAGTTGNNCENFVMKYNDALMKKLSPCSTEHTTENSIVTSPEYPHLPMKATSCTQVIRAPKCKKAVITFLDFQLYAGNCLYEYVLLRGSVRDKGQKYCGKQITKGSKIRSGGSMLIIDYIGRINWSGSGNPNQGYKAVVSFEPIAGCTP